MKRGVVLSALLLVAALSGCRSSRTATVTEAAIEDVRREGVEGMWRSFADSLRLVVVVTIDSPKIVIGEQDRPRAVFEGRRLKVEARGSADVSADVRELSAESLDSQAEVRRSEHSECLSQPSATPQKALLALGLLALVLLFIIFRRKC